MTIAPTPTSSFDVLTRPVQDELLGAAAAATTRAVSDRSQGVLVVVLRPAGDEPHVISGGGTGILRAAVSVAVAAGNDRAWRDAPDEDTVEQPVRSLPEVIAAAADTDGVRSVHTGCVRVGDTVESVALWFETPHGVASPEDRRAVLASLAEAGERERRRIAEETANRADADPGATDGPRTREFDPDDPSLDPLTGVLRSERFTELLDEFERDEAMLVLLDLDGFAAVAEEYGADASDLVLREVADRLVGSCRRADTVARIGHDRFAVLFGAIDRSEVVHVAKRLLASVAEPLPDGLGPEGVTATVALAHQVGLVDLEEMLDAAEGALASGKRSGTGRLVLAA